MAPPFWASMALIISLGLIFIVIGRILQQAEQASQKITWILISAMITASIWSISTYLQLYVTINDDVLAYTIIATLGNAGILIGLMLLVIFWNLLVEPSPNYVRLLYLAGIAALLIGLEMGSIIMGLGKQQALAELTWQVADLFNALFAALVIYFRKP